MNATLELIGSDGFGRVTIAAVAQSAGVTRQTVCSIFGSREDLVSQAISDLLLRMSADIRARLEQTEGLSNYLVELLVAGRNMVRDDAILSRLLRPDPGNPVFDPGMIRRAKPVAREVLSPLVARYPGIETELDDIGEIVIRLGLSVVLFDDPAVETDDQLRRFIVRWVVPALPAEYG